jgi:hypothetical protein
LALRCWQRTSWAKAAPYHRTLGCGKLYSQLSPKHRAKLRYANRKESARLAEAAHGHYEEGVSTRDIGDKYVKVTVLLVTVLLLTALS